MIKFRCHNCNQKLGVPDEYAGRRVRCTKCDAPTNVPQSANQSQLEPVPVAAQIDQERLEDSSVELAPDSGPDPFEDFEDFQLQKDDFDGNDFQSEDIDPTEFSQSQSSSLVGSSGSFAGQAYEHTEHHRKPVAGSELAKGAAKIPLSLAACFGAMVVVIFIWVIIGKLTGFELGLIVMAVPAAGAWGLTRFTEKRGVMLGLLCILIGLIGMVSGRMAVAKWVIMPIIQQSEEFNEFNQGIKEGFQETAQDEADALSDADVKDIANDDDEMMFIAAASLVSSGQLERETLKQMITLEFEQAFKEEVDTEGAAIEPAETAEPTPQVKQGYEMAIDKLFQWDQPAREQAVRDNYAQLTIIRGEALFGSINEKVDIVSTFTFIIAFFASFGLFDLLWIPMGIYSAYKIGAGTYGD